ncbi:MAG: hypothetical protein ACKO0U_01320, partial [Gammaproteobacteria bacterium]
MEAEGKRAPTGRAHRGLVSALLWGSACAWPVVAAAATPETPAVAPSGYSGAINTPTGDVLPLGTAVVSYTGNNPELQRIFGDNAFGSVTAGWGLLPGLEVIGRLAIT